MLSINNRLRESKAAFTLVEILVIIAILAILAIVTFVVVNPIERINQANDNVAKQELQAVLRAMVLYSEDNDDALPTYNSGTALPTVTAADVMTGGADVAKLDGLVPDYMTSMPNKGYRAGVLSSGALIVGSTLSDGLAFTVTE